MNLIRKESPIKVKPSVRDDLARQIYAAAYLRGEFKLRSGQVSDEYFDKYQFEAIPELLRAICKQLLPLIPPQTELLAGLEMGGIPIATLLSHYTGTPCVFVRKQAKTYGTGRLAEGPDVRGRRLTIIEDVVTSGGQIILSTNSLKSAGAIIEDAICVIDRLSGGSEKLSAAGINLLSLLTIDQLRENKPQDLDS